ncbi:MAG: ECF transporter S component [Velocimicrobium sp.]
MNNTSKKTLGIVQIALFSAIIFVLAMVPGLGYIPLGVIRATTIHIPVIIGALVLGPKKGAVLGGAFGLTSFINNTLNPTVTSFVFSPILATEMAGALGAVKSTIICFLPRILIGVISYFVYRLIRKLMKNTKSSMVVALACAGVAGSLTNTLLVMNLIYLFFGNAYASAREMSYQALYGAILAIIGTNGIPEAIVAGILVTAIGKVFFKSRILN